LAGALGLNYPEFPDSCRRIELVYGFDLYLIQLGHEPLGKPDGSAVYPHLDTQSAILIDQQLSFGGEQAATAPG